MDRSRNASLTFRESAFLSAKLVAIIAGVVLGAALLGWVYGASGRSDLEQARRVEAHRADLMEARALMFEGQVAVLQLNFGDATKRFEGARVVVERMQAALRETGQAERAGRLEIVLSNLRDAQRLAIALDANARTAAQTALQALAASQG